MVNLSVAMASALQSRMMPRMRLDLKIAVEEWQIAQEQRRSSMHALSSKDTMTN